jgi:hypothetical protein
MNYHMAQEHTMIEVTQEDSRAAYPEAPTALATRVIMSRSP